MTESVKNQQKVYLFRPAYFNKQLVQAKHLSLEQDYQDQLRAMDAQYLSGWGMVSGGEVSRAPVRFPWMVKVTPGYGKTALGEPLYIESLQQLNLYQQALAFMKCSAPCGIDPLQKNEWGGHGTGHDMYVGYLLAKYRALRVQKEPYVADDFDGHDNNYGIGGRCYGVEFDFVCHNPFKRSPGEFADKSQSHCIANAATDLSAELPEALGENANTLILASIGFNANGIQCIDMQTDRQQLIPYPELLKQVEALNCELDVLKNQPPVDDNSGHYIDELPILSVREKARFKDLGIYSIEQAAVLSFGQVVTILWGDEGRAVEVTRSLSENSDRSGGKPV